MYVYVCPVQKHHTFEPTLLTVLNTGRDRQIVSGIIYSSYMYILYLRGGDIILAILETGLPPITTTIVGEWLDSLVCIHDNIKCIMANG